MILVGIFGDFYDGFKGVDLSWKLNEAKRAILHL